MNNCTRWIHSRTSGPWLQTMVSVRRNSVPGFTEGRRSRHHFKLSSDQLRAASLIGRNAVTWLCALLIGAVKFLIAEHSEVRKKTRHLTVKFLSADFAAASKNSGKNPCCLLKIDNTSLMDANENEHTSRRLYGCFLLLVIKFMICHY